MYHGREDALLRPRPEQTVVHRFPHGLLRGQRRDDRLAEPFNVHGPTRHEMLDAAADLGRAVQVFAAPGRRLRIADDFAAARRAFPARMGKQIERHGLFRPLFRNHFDHRRNHFARLFDDHRVPDSDVLALHFVFVVQRGPGDGRTGQLDRLQLRHRRQHPRASHLQRDGLEHG